MRRPTKRSGSNAAQARRDFGRVGPYPLLVVSKARSIIQVALRPGADLTHYPHLCAVDALHALGRTRHPLARLLIHAHMGQLDLPKLVEAVKDVVLEVADRQSWHINGLRSCTAEEMVERIARQVVSEFLGVLCAKCRGRGHVGGHRGVVKPCGACAGAGSQPDTTRTRGRALGYDQALIVRVWGARLNAVLARLREIEQGALRGATRDLRDVPTQTT